MQWGATDCKGRACIGERPTVTGGHAMGSRKQFSSNQSAVPAVVMLTAP